MEQISLCIMTRELCQQLYQGWENDPAIYLDMGSFAPYRYDKEAVDRYFDGKQTPDRVLFAILKDGVPVGELHLKRIDRRTGSAPSASICRTTGSRAGAMVRGRSGWPFGMPLTFWAWRRSTRTPWPKTPAASTYWRSWAFSTSGTRGSSDITAISGDQKERRGTRPRRSAVSITPP